MSYWLVAFDSTHHALRAEAEFDGAGLETDTCPTPKSVTAGCALSIEFEPKDFETVKSIIDDREIVVRGYFRPEGDTYVKL